jgi:hypothetical protein
MNTINRKPVAVSYLLIAMSGMLGGCMATESSHDDADGVSAMVEVAVEEEGTIEVSEAVQDADNAVEICDGVTILYEHSNFSGRPVKYNVRKKTHNLTNWGFNDMMTSFETGGCGVTFYEHINRGGKSFYRGPWYFQANVGPDWNDKVSSIYIH